MVLRLGRCVAICATIFTHANEAAALPAFPGCEGYGCNTRHAYTSDPSPDIYFVNTLDCSASRVDVSGTRCPTDADFVCGSDYRIYEAGFETAVEASGPKLVLVEVGGETRCNQVTINPGDDEAFIAGQTAPDPGLFVTRSSAIIITTYGVGGTVGDIVIQHIRMLGGDAPGSDCEDHPSSCDNFTTYLNVRNVVLDHVSAHFDQDENINIYTTSENVTVSSSIMSHPLTHNDDVTPGFGPLIGSKVSSISLVKNLISHQYFRGPMISDSPAEVIVVNNVMYNYGAAEASASNVTYKADGFGVMKVSYEGNYFDKGANSPGQNSVVSVTHCTDGDPHPCYIYCADNYLADADTTWTSCDKSTMFTLYSGADFTESSSRTPAYPSGDEAIVVLDHAVARAHVLANAGAYPAFRAHSKYDQAAIQDATAGTGSRHDTVAEYGGWGTMTASGPSRLLLPGNPHADDDGDGYTNLEEWLHRYARLVEGSESAPSPPQGLQLLPGERT